MIKNMGMVFTHIQMGDLTKETGAMENSMVKEYL